MPRRAKIAKREILPDPRYNSRTVTMFINKIMERGKKTTAQRIMYDALTKVEAQTRKNAMDTFEVAVRNVTPTIEVKPRRVGGATYQVPVEVRPERRTALAMRWILEYSRARTEKDMAERLAAELILASKGEGNVIKKKEDTHRMAEANRAFAHYRW